MAPGPFAEPAAFEGPKPAAGSSSQPEYASRTINGKWSEGKQPLKPVQTICASSTLASGEEKM
jgi:hypothetical protein